MCNNSCIVDISEYSEYVRSIFAPKMHLNLYYITLQSKKNLDLHWNKQNNKDASLSNYNTFKAVNYM